ncbi:MAG: phosphatidylglycerophosphatase A [Candidatus Omnitrophota bacterium]
MLKILVRLLGTFFYIGYLPLIPGTFGSLAGIALYLLVQKNPWVYLFLTLLLIIIGFWVSNKAEKLMGRKDPSCVVIDEVCGMLVSLLFIPFNLRFLIIAFVFFRILDTLKPFPSGRLEKRGGGIGVMSDDLIAGIYTNLILQAVLRLISFRAS